MRYAFGLVGLLVTVALIVWLMSISTGPTLRKGSQAKQQASQIAGRTEDGRPIGDTIKLEPQLRDGRLESIQVKSIEAGGAMQQYYGLQIGDEIIQVGSLDMETLSDPGMAIASIQEGPQRQSELIVLRNGQRLTLPQQSTAPAANQLTTPPPARKGIQDQLDLIRTPQSTDQ